MRRIVLWRGYHSKEIAQLVKHTWNDEDLLILYPPGLHDVSFLPLLPSGELHWQGDWQPEEIVRAGEIVGDRAYPETPVFGVFSTGTMGRKLVLYSKRNIESCLDSILALFDEPIDSVFCYPQPFHTFGLVLGYVHCHLKGRRLVTEYGPYSKATHKQWLLETDPTLLTLGTPTHFKDLLSLSPSPRPTYSAIVGAAKVEVSLWRSLREALHIRKPSIGYGATEASPGVTHLPPGREPREEGEIGHPLEHLEVQVLPGRGLQFSGPGVCLAIIKDGELSFPDHILIADEVEKLDDGSLVYRGRTGLTLNRGGEKFSLESMEAVLKEKLGVEAVCVRLPDDRLGDELGVLAKGPAEPQTVYSLLQSVFRRQFNPLNFAVVSELPIDGSAKIDRATCLHLLIRGMRDD